MNRKQFIFTLLLALLSGLMGGVLSVWFLMPQSVPAQESTEKIITAEGLTIVDENGVPRVIVRAGVLGLADANGDTRLTIFENQAGIGVTLYDDQPNNMRRASLSVAEGSPALIFYDREEKVSVRLRLLDDSPSLNLSDQIVLIANQQNPMIAVADENKNLRVVLGIADEPSIQINDEKGNAVWGASASTGTFEGGK